LQAQGRHEEAAAHYERALALKPDMADARFGMAACLQACGRNEEAIACYQFLLATDPAHPEANYGLATLLAQHGRADEAVEKFRAALAADPDFAAASFGLGKLLARGDAVEEAIGYFLHALDVDPVSPSEPRWRSSVAMTKPSWRFAPSSRRCQNMPGRITAWRSCWRSTAMPMKPPRNSVQHSPPIPTLPWRVMGSVGFSRAGIRWSKPAIVSCARSRSTLTTPMPASP
jgi:tetratricopeptide (TPR) repeat protein